MRRLLPLVLLLACQPKINPNKEVKTVVDQEVGIVVWHDDKNRVTCWVGPEHYTMVCLPDHMLRVGAEANPKLGQSASISKKVVDDQAAAAAAAASMNNSSSD